MSPKLSVGGYPVPFSTGPVSSVKVFANFGKGIKNPNFSELFGSGFVDGNANLNPERARTIDVGTEMTFSDQRWLTRVTYFDNNYKDQVAFQFSPGFGGDGIPDYINIAGSKANGVELEVGLQRPIGGVTVSATYALVDTEVVATVSTSEQFQPGQPLLRRPKHSGTVRVNYTRGRGSLHLNLRAVSERHDAAFTGLARVSDGRSVDITVNPGYTVIGVGGQFRLDDDVTLFLRLDNLTDEVYESALGHFRACRGRSSWALASTSAAERGGAESRHAKRSGLPGRAPRDVFGGRGWCQNSADHNPHVESHLRRSERNGILSWLCVSTRAFRYLRRAIAQRRRKARRDTPRAGPVIVTLSGVRELGSVSVWVMLGIRCPACKRSPC